MVLKQLVDHAYSFSHTVDNELAGALSLMVKRLQTAGTKRVDSLTIKEWCLFTDASFANEACEGGLGGVLTDSTGNCKAWFFAAIGPWHLQAAWS